MDYITKPISPPILLARINTHLTLKDARDFLRDKNKFLEREILKRTEEIVAIQDVTIMALASLKVGVPDNILLKPAKLTPDEFAIMQKHTILGRDAISSAEQRVGKIKSFLEIAKEIAYSHQKKWSGTGYPEGLAGDGIPISARLMAVADVYDALIGRRIYKPAFPYEQAVEIIKSGYGIHFDPDVVDAFVDIADQCFEVAKKYSSAEEDIKRK